MRVEVRYPTGAVHRVDLPGRVAILGRDPTCDLVLNDPKCSRRHAVLEEDPGGPIVRDTGSANGVFVNGKKVARATLREGDQVQVGDLVLKVLPPPGEGTLIMAPEDLLAPPPPVAPYAPTVGKPISASEVAAEMARMEADDAARQAAPPPRSGEPPAPLRREVSGEIVLQRSKTAPTGPAAVEAAPAARKLSLPLILLVGGAVLAVALVTMLLLAALFLIPRATRSGVADTRPWWERTVEGLRLGLGSESNVANQLRILAAAEQAFRMVCNSGYGDLEALLNPSSVFPDYPKSGPAFLKDGTFRQPERLGYRFQLTVEDAVPPTPSCPFRSYRRYSYSATPLKAGGRTLVVGNDGVVRAVRAAAAR